MITRTETFNDYAAITQVTLAAFTGRFSDNPTEHLIVMGLREAGALSLSLVAELDGKIVGHVAFSKVTINGDDQDWYGLGPISVQPDLQKQGIGSRLIQAGLAKIREMGAQGCVLEGDPNYYNRFGFKSYPHLIYESAPTPQYFMALPFYTKSQAGKSNITQRFIIVNEQHQYCSAIITYRFLSRRDDTGLPCRILTEKRSDNIRSSSRSAVGARLKFIAPINHQLSGKWWSKFYLHPFRITLAL